MAARQMPIADPVYENFEPSTEWVREPTDDVLLVFLPGFKKEQVKVQVTSTRKLRISGERPIGNNKRSRFAKEMEIPSNCNTNGTSAKFEKGTLSIRLPRNIAPAQTQKPAEAPKPRTDTPIPQKPPQQKAQQPRESVPKPQKPPQEKAQPPRESVPKPQKPTQEKAQPPRELVPKLQKPPQEKAQQLRESIPKPQKPPQEKVQPPRESVLKKEEEAVVQEEAVPKTNIDKPKSENNVPKSEAEEVKKESPGDHEENKRSDVDSINNIPAKIDKPSLAHKYKQVLGGLMVEMKQPKKQKNLLAVLLLIVVIVLSAKSALRSLVKFNKTETSSSDYQA